MRQNLFAEEIELFIPEKINVNSLDNLIRRYIIDHATTLPEPSTRNNLLIEKYQLDNEGTTLEYVHHNMGQAFNSTFKPDYNKPVIAEVRIKGLRTEEFEGLYSEFVQKTGQYIFEEPTIPLETKKSETTLYQKILQIIYTRT